jgi:hypothetical protein
MYTITAPTTHKSTIVVTRLSTGQQMTAHVDKDMVDYWRNFYKSIKENGRIKYAFKVLGK